MSASPIDSEATARPPNGEPNPFPMDKTLKAASAIAILGAVGLAFLAGYRCGYQFGVDDGRARPQDLSTLSNQVQQVLANPTNTVSQWLRLHQQFSSNKTNQ